MLRNIVLYGSLKDDLGGPFRFDIDSPGEAVRALCANFKHAFQIFKEGIFVLVMGDAPETGEPITQDMVNFNLGKSDLHILPAATGAGGGNAKGIVSVVLGVGLLATGVGGAFLAADAAGSSLMAGLGATTFFGIGTYGGLALMGTGLLLGGIASLATNINQPPQTGPTTASFLINGPTQNTTQGTAVPLVFGRMRVGSTVVSTIYEVAQIPIGSLNFTTQLVNLKGKLIDPAVPPTIALPGAEVPRKAEIQPDLLWQYPYPQYQ